MSAINSYIHKIAHLIPVFVFVIILFRVFRLTYLRKKGYRSPLRREILMGIYLMFILAIFSQTVFSDLDSFMQEGWKNINLTPFKFVLHTKTASDTYFLVNVLGNIAFFIPLGIMTPMLFCGNSFILSVGGGALFSLIIELMQLPILRATDIDDIILNTTGAVIGYVIYLIISKRFPKIKSMFKIK